MSARNLGYGDHETDIVSKLWGEANLENCSSRFVTTALALRAAVGGSENMIKTDDWLNLGGCFFFFSFFLFFLLF